MNSLLSPHRENSENQARMYPCLYCNKVFTNYRALGGHNKAHNVQIRSSVRRNYLTRSKTRTNLDSLSNNQLENSSKGGANNQTIFMGSCPNDTISMNATFAPSANSAATSYPSNPKLFLGSSEVCQFNTDEKRICRDGRPLFCGDASENFSLNFIIPVPNPSFGLDLNESPSFNETTIVGSSPVNPCPFSGSDQSCQPKTQSFTFSDEHRDSVDAPADATTIRASKRHKNIVSMNTDKSLIKEPPIFQDVENRYTEIGIPFDAEQEGPSNIDLSLHL